MTAPGWWRRNRWGLVALPVTVVAALAASSYRVEAQWWLEKPRDLVSASQGEWVSFTSSQYDRTGDVPFTVRVRLDGVRPAEALFDSASSGDLALELPAGVEAVAVDLSLAAPPDVPLSTCDLVVRDAAGTEYAYRSSTPSTSQAASPCVPPDTPGPDLDLFEGLDPDTGPARPAEWQVSPVVLLPDGVEVAEVLLSWGPPDGLLISAG